MLVNVVNEEWSRRRRRGIQWLRWLWWWGELILSVSGWSKLSGRSEDVGEMKVSVSERQGERWNLSGRSIQFRMRKWKMEEKKKQVVFKWMGVEEDVDGSDMYTAKWSCYSQTGDDGEDANDINGDTSGIGWVDDFNHLGWTKSWELYNSEWAELGVGEMQR